MRMNEFMYEFLLRMLRLTQFINDRTGSSTASRRRQWESKVSTLIAASGEKTLEKAAARFKAKYEAKAFKSVADAFPESHGMQTSPGPSKPAAVSSPFGARVYRAALIGVPNAGKSSLVNALTHRLATAEGRARGMTNAVVRSACTVDVTQLIFVDTPGVEPPARQSRLATTKNQSGISWDALSGVDCALLCVPISNNGFLDVDNKWMLEHAAQKATARMMPMDLVMTKMDRVQSTRQRDFYFSMRSEVEGLGIPFRRTFETSVTNSTGLIEIKDHLCSVAPVRAWEHSDEQRSSIDVIREVIRQSFFTHLPHQVPYDARFEIVGWTPKTDGAIEVFVEVFVSKQPFMFVFYSRQDLIRLTCVRLAQRELSKKFIFSFQVFVATEGIKRD